jgi:hypothetical protein
MNMRGGKRGAGMEEFGKYRRHGRKGQEKKKA